MPETTVTTTTSNTPIAILASASSRRTAQQFARRCLRGLGRHWLFAVAAGCATALRAVVLLAYQPALIFPDSERYLQYAWRFVIGHWSPGGAPAATRCCSSRRC